MTSQNIDDRIADLNKQLIAVSSQMLREYGTPAGARLSREYNELLDELVELNALKNPEKDWDVAAA